MRNLAIIAVGVVSFLAVAANAAEPLYLGVQGGMNYGAASSPADIGRQNKTGFLGGLHFDLPISEAISFQPELMYLSTTSKLEAGGISAYAHADSLEVPMLLKLKMGGPIAPYIFAGPNFIWNVSRNVDYGSSTQAGSMNFNLNSTDWALDVGAGLKVGTLFASLRYSFALTSAERAQVAWRSRGLQLIAGMQFPL